MREDPTEELLQQLLKAHDQLAERTDAVTPPAQSAFSRYQRWLLTRGRTGSRPGFVGRERLVFAGGISAVVIGVATLLGVQASVSPTSALAARMNRVAIIASKQTWTGIPAKGKYLYTESYELTNAPTMTNNKQCNIEVLVHREIWRATDGSGALAETAAGGRFSSAADKRVCASMGITNPASTDRSGANTYPSGKAGLPFITDNWRAYSTNPRVLLRQVHQHDGGPNTPAELLVNVVDYLREADTPPAIRAALYRATALIPGVRLLGQRTDPRGQRGSALAISPHRGQRYVVIFNAHNARLLAEEHLTDGRLTSWSAYTKQAIVDTHPAFPLSTN
jgi:hypothetical protein